MADVSDERLDDAINALLNHQQQLDMDGVIVGVSRQAIHEVVDALQARRAAEAEVVEALKWYVDQSDEGGWIICDSKGRKLTTYRDLMMRGRAALGARND